MSANLFLALLAAACLSQGWGTSVRPRDLTEDILRARGLLEASITGVQSLNQKVADFYYVYVSTELPTAARAVDDALVNIGINNVEMEILRTKYNSGTTRSKDNIDRVLFPMDIIVTRVKNTLIDLNKNLGGLETDVAFMEEAQAWMQEEFSSATVDIRNMTAFVGESALDLIQGLGGDEAAEVRTMVQDIYTKIGEQYGRAMESNYQYSKVFNMATSAVRYVISQLPRTHANN